MDDNGIVLLFNKEIYIMENDKNNKENIVRDKIILFVIGVLVGAVISTAAFFVYTKTLVTNGNINNNSSHQMPSGTPPEMPSNDQNGGTPPEMPNNNSQGNQDNTPPEKPSDDNSNSGNS